jgi:predicted nuclease of restriction endonuclease-like RecB superfamily
MAKSPLTTIVPELVRFKEITVTAQVKHGDKIYSEELRIKVSCLEQHKQHEVYPYSLALYTIIAESDAQSSYGFDSATSRDAIYQKVDEAFCQQWVALQIALIN